MATERLTTTLHVTFVIKRSLYAICSCKLAKSDTINSRVAEVFSVDKLERRIMAVVRDNEISVIDVPRIIDSVIRSSHPVIATRELERFLAYACAQLAHIHPMYDKLAGRIEMGRLHKETPQTFTESVQELMKGPTALLTMSYMQSVSIFLPSLEAALVDDRDFDFTYDAVLSLERFYLLRFGDRLMERPQHLFMRISVATNADSLEAILETYNLLSTLTYYHGHSSMIYAGTTLGQMVPAFSLRFDIESDVTKTDTLTECAMISYGGGSIGLGLSDYPPDGVNGTSSESTGLRMILRVLDDMTKRIGQSSTRGRGRMTAYIELWHTELYVFIKECQRMARESPVYARGIFFGLCAPDIFWRRVEEHGSWSFFKPADVPDLMQSYGEDFDALYRQYETMDIVTQTLPARDVLDSIITAQIEGVGPAIVFKEAMNQKSNFSHLGCINFAGQAAETILPAPSQETGMCNTASIVLPKFVLDNGTFDYDRLHSVVKTVTRNLNRTMALNAYPSLGSAISYVRHRSLGIGITGLADAFITMCLPFESETAIETSRLIMETIYHSALETSCELVDVYGTHSSYPGSPLSFGRLQFDLWDLPLLNTRYDWQTLRQQVRERGVVNAQLVLLRDTGGASRLSGFSEGCEPFLSNLLIKRIGRFQYLSLNPRLVHDIQKLGLWSEQLRLKLMLSRGSVRFIEEIPINLKKLYKSAWEIDTDFVIKHAISRGPFVCQSQSIVLYREKPTKIWLYNALFYAWRGGLKTGLFYLRSGKREYMLGVNDVEGADEDEVEPI